MRRFLFRDADPVARVVIGEGSKQMQVDAVEGADSDGNVALQQRPDYRFQSDRLLLAGEVDRLALHQVFGALMELVVRSLRRRILVVAFAVCAVMTRAETFWITGEPSAVGVTHDVV